jgi:predicted nuclease of predicted toxin-antitoxin system
LKILLDHNLDRRLKRYLEAHETFTTQEQNWADALNGELIALAEQNGFEVLITADANIKHQQNLANRNIAIIVLRALNNRLSTHAEMTPEVLGILEKIQPCEIMEVLHKDIKRN